MTETTLSLHPLQASCELPLLFNDPFDYEPHPLCQQAADEVRLFIASQPTLLADAQKGKMFGVLVVRRASDSRNSSLFFLAAYSGLLAGRNDWSFFVPPVFDAQQPDGHFKQTERYISSLNAEVERLSEELASLDDSSHPSPDVGSRSATIQTLKQERKQRSEELQQWLFRQYRMLNARGEEKDLVDIWHDYHSSPKLQQRFPLPPGGSGDCCAPKLLQYAYQHHLQPVAMAEFWFGESPKSEIRHHGQYYPACRGKCLPILTFMLQGLEMEKRTSTPVDWSSRLQILYEDDSLLVVDKPSGLLSVPGRIQTPSVEEILATRYGMVWMHHRLDMDTSGLLVVARSEEAYKQLQQQFFARTIYKRYEALVERQHAQTDTVDPPSCMQPLTVGNKDTISLPLRPDPLDRPRQVVDLLHGKQAITDYEVLEERASGASDASDASSSSSPSIFLVSLTPHTGRTHQLRVHCAHPDGLNAPIVGDNLYGRKAQRLCLHAAELIFTHPKTGERLHFQSEADFKESLTAASSACS